MLARGYFLAAREAFRVLLEQGRGGSIVFVGSKNALVAGANAAAYSSAKAASLHLARCLAEEGGPHGIRVNTVNPDAVIAGLEHLVVRMEGRAGEHLRRRRGRAARPSTAAARSSASTSTPRTSPRRSPSSPGRAPRSRPGTSSTSTAASPPPIRDEERSERRRADHDSIARARRAVGVTALGSVPLIERTCEMSHTRRVAARWGSAVTAIALLGTAVVLAASGAGGLKTGQTFYFIPKDTLNPYEVIADGGGKLALNEIGDKQVVSSGTQDTAAAQQPSIQAAIQSGAAGDRDRRQRPAGRLPVAEAGDGQGDRGRLVRLRHELPPALHQPGGHRDDRPQPDPAARQGDGLQGPVRDPLGRLHGDQPERLDQVHEARAEEARVQEHAAGQDLLRQRQPGAVAAGDGEHAPGVPEPEGDRVADDGRHLVGGAVPRRTRSTRARSC